MAETEYATMSNYSIDCETHDRREETTYRNSYDWPDTASLSF